MTTRTVTDTILHTDGSAWAGATVTFLLLKGSYTGAAAYPRDTITVTTNSSGVYSAVLWCDEEGVIATRYEATYPSGERFKFDLPIGDGTPVAMSALRSAVPYVAAANLATLLSGLAFTDLADTPDAYAGQAGKVVAVNSGATALEFVTGGGGGGGAPTGAAGGVLSGTYPNPGFAADMATQAELDAEATARTSADTALQGNITAEASTRATADTTNAGNLTTHAALTTAAHGGIVASNDSRLSDSRTPTAHAASHAAAGGDALTLAQSQITSLVSDLAAKAPLASPTFTGTPAAPTAAGGTSTTQIATTAFTTGAVATEATARAAADTTLQGNIDTNAAAIALKAPLDSPALTGTPTAPTATGGTSTTQIATTAFVAAGFQPLDSDLTAIAALSTTSFGRALLALADAAALRTSAALGTAATANTGTGSSDVPTITQADARYQPLDSDLTAIAALSTTTFGRSLLTAADAAALQSLAGTVIGTDVQAQDAELAAVAGLTSAANKLPYFTGSGTAALTDLTPAARTVLDDASTSAMLTTLGGQTAVAEGRTSIGGTTYLTVPGFEVLNNNTLVFSNNQDRFAPIFVTTPITIDQLVVEVTTASGSAGSTARLGIYQADTSWQVGALVVDAGTVANDSIGVKTVSVSVTLQPGRYFSAINMSVSATLRVLIGANRFVGYATTLGSPMFIYSLTNSRTYGAFPDPGTAINSVQMTTVGMRQAMFFRVSTP